MTGGNFELVGNELASKTVKKLMGDARIAYQLPRPPPRIRMAVVHKRDWTESPDVPAPPFAVTCFRFDVASDSQRTSNAAASGTRNNCRHTPSSPPLAATAPFTQGGWSQV